jgi:hypothetical protein
MKKLVLQLPLAVGLISSASPLIAPMANAATVTLIQTSGTANCTYSSVSTDASGNMSVTCSGASPTAAPPATPTASPPSGTPTASPPASTPTAAPPAGNCVSPEPANARRIEALQKPPNGGTFPSGQDHYNNPATTTSDGTIASSQILVIPFNHTGTANTTRATLGPGNYGGVSGFQMAISKCPGSFDPADYATPNNIYCERKANAPTIYFQYCTPQIGSNYYVNVKPVGPQEPTTAFVFNFN